VQLDHLNRHFMDIIKIAVSVRKEAEKDLKVPFDNFESSLFRLYRNRIFGWSRGRKFVRSALQPLEKSLY